MKIHLIRHTTPKIAPGICYGQTDLELADSFESEKWRLHGKLAIPYDAVYTSPLQRCHLLANTIQTQQLYIDARLKEYDFGDWERMPWNQIQPDVLDQWMQDYVALPAPNGDSMLSMRDRVMAFWEALLALDYQSAAVVTHAGVVRLIHAEISGLPLHDVFELKLDFGAVFEVDSCPGSNQCSIRRL